MQVCVVLTLEILSLIFYGQFIYFITKMSGERDKCSLNWSPPGENTEDIVSIELSQEVQRELECIIGENIFLEYPWAFVCREKLMQQAYNIDSPLNIYKDRMELNKCEYFLIGYASNELIANDFVICLTDEARNIIVKRNRDITKNIIENVRRMIIKTGRARDLSPESGKKISKDIFVDRSRPQFEVELSVNINNLKRQQQLTDRNSNDARDGYIDLVPDKSQKFNNIFMKKISKTIQSTLIARDASVQSYLGYPKNKWTQCIDSTDIESSDTMKEKDEEKGEQEEAIKPDRQATSEESSSAGLSETITVDKETSEEIVLDSKINMQEKLQLSFFLQSHISEVNDYVEYNSEINIHSSDIENLMIYDSRNFHRMNNANYYLFEESWSLIDLSITKGRVISDVSWHRDLVGFVAISYLSNPPCQTATFEEQSEMPSESFDSNRDTRVLIWSLDEVLKPKLRLNESRDIQLVSFCPARCNVLIGGCTNGQLVLWDLRDSLNNISELNSQDEIPTINPVVFSHPDQSHSSAICALQWLPSEYRIESNGMLNKLPENISMQFMTCSDDGTVAIWDLLWQPNLSQAAKSLKTIVTVTMSLTDDLERLDGIFRPHYRIQIQLPEQSIKRSLLDFCISSFNNSDDDSHKLWIATDQGEVLLCSWQGQEYEVTDEENCKVIDCTSCVHDGPVIQIIRSTHLIDILLTIGGSVFAIWYENCMKYPIIWRKRGCCYTACCWSHRPGVFILARCDGDLETWDLYRKTRQPVHVQTICGKLITGLYTHYPSHKYSNIIGICDDNGIFRFVKESIENESMHEERIGWFSKFIKNEVERKNEFHAWENDYLLHDKMVLEKKAMRVTMEAKKRHEEARKKFLREQEELAKIKAEKKMHNVVPSKEAILRMKNIERMKCTLLEKKGFNPEELERIRYPLVQQQVEETIRIDKAHERVANSEEYFSHAVAIEFPEISEHSSGLNIYKPDEPVQVDMRLDDSVDEYQRAYMRISNEAKMKLRDNPHVPKFNWNLVMKEGKLRRNYLGMLNTSIHSDST